MASSSDPALFEWNEEKRERTLEKHGIDFVDAIRVFDGDVLVAASRGHGEKRFVAVGLLDGIEIAIIFTIRGDAIRVITARRARRHEREAYHAHLPRGGP
ncbi:MAG TPA: BrnT family toxin [Thermohalobaculum sp.]|nr:BrnT family toxin [Thermohalobaculum sp.]